MEKVSKEEIELYEQMKDLPDFDRLPLPSTWFKAFNLKPREAVAPREFIESGYTLKRQLEQKDLPPIFIDEPQQNGKLVEVPEDKNLPVVEVINRPFKYEGHRFPDVLPALKELPDADAPADASKTEEKEEQQFAS